jgi:hypothetical protein
MAPVKVSANNTLCCLALPSAAGADGFFPIDVTFSSPQTLCQLEVPTVSVPSPARPPSVFKSIRDNPHFRRLGSPGGCG